MKKNYGIIFSFAVLLIAAMVTMAGCGDADSGDPASPGDPQTVTYTGTSAGTRVTLKIIENTSRGAYTPQEGDEYELTVGTQESKGVVNSFSDGVFTLKPSNAQATFTATVSGGGLSALSGTITWTDNTTSTGPGTVTPSDPNPDPDPGDETLPELPSSIGTNEVGGKTYNPYGDHRWEFSTDGTYRYFEEDDGEWTEKENGNYSWNSSGGYKTVTLAPQRFIVEGSLYDKAEWKDAFRSAVAAYGYTDALIAKETDGEYTTLTAFIDANADYTFAFQLYNYTMRDGAIDTFDGMGAYGYGTAKGGKIVVKNNTSSTLTVKTSAGYAETERTTSVSARGSSQVFESGYDTFLTGIKITSSGSFTQVDI
jgi:hypothetical protein